MERLEKILTILSLDNLHSNFVQEKIDVDDIPHLSDRELYQLGVTTIGDRNRLKKLCQTGLTNNISSRQPMEGATNVKSVHQSTEEYPLTREATQDSWNSATSTMVVPESLTNLSNHNGAESIRGIGVSNQIVDVSNQGTDVSNRGTGASNRGMDVVMGDNASVTIGDRGNITRTGDKIEAEEIDVIETSSSTHAAETTSNFHTGLTDNARIRLGEGAVLDIGNQNNVSTKGSMITAKKIGKYVNKMD